MKNLFRFSFVISRRPSVGAFGMLLLSDRVRFQEVGHDNGVPHHYMVLTIGLIWLRMNLEFKLRLKEKDKNNAKRN